MKHRVPRKEPRHGPGRICQSHDSESAIAIPVPFRDVCTIKLVGCPSTIRTTQWRAYNNKRIVVIALLLAISCLACGGYYWWRHRLSDREQASRTARTPKRFAAVEIRLRGAHCDAALAHEGRRFLAYQAPALPLEGCTKTRCGCSFEKLDDRRAEDRRLEHSGLHAASFIRAERRRRTSRREGE